MFLRMNRLLIDLPEPTSADPNAAAALQELLGGKFGEMSTLNNYMFQSFNFRSKTKLKPFYDLVASITAEELGHVELVTTGCAMVANGPPKKAPTGHPSDAPWADMKDVRDASNFLSGGGAGLPFDSMGRPWNGTFVFHTGNLVLDLLHNFFLECGARMHKLRVYETVSNPTAREVCGYLLVRGSVHAQAYALALKKITGVSIEKMLPVPNIQLSSIPESAKYEAEGIHRRLYRNSPEDFDGIKGIWSSDETTYDGSGPLEIMDMPPESGRVPDLDGASSAFTPDYAPEEIFEIAAKLYAASKQ